MTYLRPTIFSDSCKSSKFYKLRIDFELVSSKNKTLKFSFGRPRTKKFCTFQLLSCIFGDLTGAVEKKTVFGQGNENGI